MGAGGGGFEEQTHFEVPHHATKYHLVMALELLHVCVCARI